MRKYILMIILVVCVIICAVVIKFGIHIGFINVLSYRELIDKNNEKNTLVNTLEYEKTQEYNDISSQIESKVKKYNEAKRKYEQGVSNGSISTDINIYSENIYDLNSVWNSIETYAKKNSVVIDMDTTQSDSNNTSESFTLCNLKFTLQGEYIAITDFLYDLEEDDSLKFEINDFEIEKNEETLNAKFVVKEIPVTNDSLQK